MNCEWSLLLPLADSGKLSFLLQFFFLLECSFSLWLCVDLSGLIHLSLITSSLFSLFISFSSAFSRSLSVRVVEMLSSEQRRNSHMCFFDHVGLCCTGLCLRSVSVLKADVIISALSCTEKLADRMFF